MIKIIALLISLATLTACGVAENLSRECGGDLKQACGDLTGRDTKRIDDLEADNAELSAQLSNYITNNVAIIHLLSEQALQQSADTVNLATQINALQTQTNINVAQLALLQTRVTVQSFIVPCGQVPSVYNETLLKMSDGTIVAYFEQGSQRFLSTLKPGNYQTTDSKACQFSVNNLMQVCDNVIGCR